jgi:hypothetical protein
MEAVTRKWLRENSRELNRRDAETLANLFKNSRCMHRRVLSGTAYTYCGQPATRYGNAKIIFCDAHRSQ